jgi:hypothetical protein
LGEGIVFAPQTPSIVRSLHFAKTHKRQEFYGITTEKGGEELITIAGYPCGRPLIDLAELMEKKEVRNMSKMIRIGFLVIVIVMFMVFQALAQVEPLESKWIPKW